MTFLLVLGTGFLLATFAKAETFRIATYNVENYVDDSTHNRHAKSAAAKAKVCESILALRPQVIALQEMGSRSALEELRASLKAGGLELPHWEHVNGHDTNIHLAILSKFPFTAVRSHTNDTFLLGGRRFHISRGFAEVDIRVDATFCFTLITAHLKSKRAIGQADEAELRTEEAKVLREKVDALLASKPNVNLVVLGDMNDTRDAEPLRVIIGRGQQKLVDLRPAERNGDSAINTHRLEARNVTWTHYFAKADLYSRLDYILFSPSMARHWVTNETYVLATPNWGIGSDHRPLVATIETNGN